MMERLALVDARHQLGRGGDELIGGGMDRLIDSIDRFIDCCVFVAFVAFFYVYVS